MQNGSGSLARVMRSGDLCRKRACSRYSPLNREQARFLHFAWRRLSSAQSARFRWRGLSTRRSERVGDNAHHQSIRAAVAGTDRPPFAKATAGRPGRSAGLAVPRCHRSARRAVAPYHRDGKSTEISRLGRRCRNMSKKCWKNWFDSSPHIRSLIGWLSIHGSLS